MPELPAIVPEIADDHIERARRLLGLEALDEPRRAFLASRSTVDVSACPGSGKTTLIVAKLAILAEGWPYRTRGICVLSHTNAAREEIQRRLSGTPVGQRLFAYPHFIDTIHGFANRFLAMPWLQAKRFPAATIDDDVTTAYRRSLLTGSEYWTIESFLNKKKSGFDRLRICDRDMAFDLGGKAFPAGPDAASFALAKKAVEGGAQAGYFCYEEMFVWAGALLDDVPAVAASLRRRFPLVILDEMQDTTDIQGALLHRIFPRTAADVVVQRVGDRNQAIFEGHDKLPDGNDAFPDGRWTVTSQFRLAFGLALK